MDQAIYCNLIVILMAGHIRLCLITVALSKAPLLELMAPQISNFNICLSCTNRTPLTEFSLELTHPQLLTTLLQHPQSHASTCNNRQLLLCLLLTTSVISQQTTTPLSIQLNLLVCREPKKCISSLTKLHPIRSCPLVVLVCLFKSTRQCSRLV